MIAAIVPFVASQAFCIALARAATSLRPSSKESTPATTKAENSPKECPATISASNLSSRDNAVITLSKNTAG